MSGTCGGRIAPAGERNPHHNTAAALGGAALQREVTTKAVHPFTDALQPETGALLIEHRVGVAALAAIFDRHLEVAGLFAVGKADAGVVRLGVLDDVERQFADGLKQEGTQVMGERRVQIVGVQVDRRP